MAQQWRLICGTVSCGTTLVEGVSEGLPREALRDTRQRARGDCTNRNDVGKVSFAVARKARGETRRAESLFSQARPGLKTAVRRSRDDRGAWPVAAARQSRKRPFVWTCPRRLRSGRRCLVGKMFVPHWKPVPDAVPPRSVRYAQGSTCHGTGLSPAQKRGSPARGESLQWRLAGIRFECVPAWVRRWRL